MRRAPLPDLVAERLASLPKKPGCYIFKDEAQDVLYVGKAVNLRSRVRSYFQENNRLEARKERMVRKVVDIEWIIVDTELEALVLECNLIKRHRPPYNVVLRDDKSYPYIQLTNENYPRLVFTRHPKRGKGQAYGPYTSSFAVRETIKLLHKTFPLIPCGKSWSGKAEQKPCLYYHLGQCLAPCAGIADKDEYRRVIEKVRKFLDGKEEDLLGDLRQDMETAAEELEFERAAKLRDQIEAVMQVMERQKVLSEDGADRDVLAVVKDERGAAVQLLYIRGGRLIGQRQFMLEGSSDTAPSEAVQEFVKQYYSEAPEIPRQVLLPVEIAEKQIVQNWLRQRRGSSVTIEVPQGGEGLRLVDLAAKNAEEALKTFQVETAKKEEFAETALYELAEELGLPSPPERIECYDISNIQGTAPVGSMVVATKGEPDSSHYRRFRIKWHPETPDDFAMMHEVLTRRLRAFLDGDPKFADLPDLIVIDGGKGQLTSALNARDALGLSVPMVGLAKKHEVIYSKDGPECFREHVLPMYSAGLTVVRRLRDEAHRFALSFHRKLRDRATHGSVLDEIPGIGPRRKRMLLRTFGSIASIRQATVEEIAAVPTLTMRQARTIHEFLRDA